MNYNTMINSWHITFLGTRATRNHRRRAHTHNTKRPNTDCFVFVFIHFEQTPQPSPRHWTVARRDAHCTLIWCTQKIRRFCATVRAYVRLKFAQKMIRHPVADASDYVHLFSFNYFDAKRRWIYTISVSDERRTRVWCVRCANGKSLLYLPMIVRRFIVQKRRIARWRSEPQIGWLTEHQPSTMTCTLHTVRPHRLSWWNVEFTTLHRSLCESQPHATKRKLQSVYDSDYLIVSSRLAVSLHRPPMGCVIETNTRWNAYVNLQK